MSVQDIQHLYKLLSDLKAQVSGFIGRSDTKHEHFDDHITHSEKRQERIESQLNAIANALLQEQTRDNVEKEVEEKTDQQEEKSDENKYQQQTALVADNDCAFEYFQSSQILIKFLDFWRKSSVSWLAEELIYECL